MQVGVLPKNLPKCCLSLLFFLVKPEQTAEKSFVGEVSGVCYRTMALATGGDACGGA
jgi:hypothetical protein